MEKKVYVCEFCQTAHKGLEDYMSCVSKCGKEWKLKKEAEEKQKRLEEVNAALNGIKEAKKYYEDLMAKFEVKYPEEYKMNFGHLYTECNCGGSCGDNCKCKEDENTTSKAFSYRKEADKEPVMKAKINGKDVGVEKLWEDPDIQYLAKLLGIK